MPVGPHILWPVNATKSAPRACTSSGMCGAACEASTTTRAPTSWARRTSSSARVDGAEDVGHVDERHDLGALGDDPVEVGQVEAAVVGEREPPQRRAGALGDQLPRHDVGVVLHLGDDDLVARAETAAGTGPRDDVGDEVERLGGVLGEHHLGAVGGVDERGHLVAGALVERGGLLGQDVDAAVHVGVVPRVVVVDARRAPAAASARSRRCRGRPAACRRGPAARGSGSPCGPSRRRALLDNMSVMPSALAGEELLVALGLEACRRAPGRPPRRSGRRTKTWTKSGWM